jgi:hypothetical protein
MVGWALLDPSKWDMNLLDLSRLTYDQSHKGIFFLPDSKNPEQEIRTS